MNFYILPRNNGYYRIEFYKDGIWQGCVLSEEADLDEWVFEDWGEHGTILMTQIFVRPCTADDIIDDFASSLMGNVDNIIDFINDQKLGTTH